MLLLSFSNLDLKEVIDFCSFDLSLKKNGLKSCKYLLDSARRLQTLKIFIFEHIRILVKSKLFPICSFFARKSRSLNSLQTLRRPIVLS